MLSMNKSTSLCFSSLKYSAIVRPVRGALILAPEVSFIWPNTMIVLSRTPDCFISFQRSLPSRERSPTPVNTEYPPCSLAMLRMSSRIRTVFPTPAPPNRPILPPLENGTRRSMTLMPVSSIVSAGYCSVNEGACLWIGHIASLFTSPLLSIG